MSRVKQRENNAAGAAKTNKKPDFFINPRTGKWQAKSLESFKDLMLDPVTVQVLSSTGAKVRMEISAAGITQSLLSESGKWLGGVDDLTKMGAVNGFLKAELQSTAKARSQDRVMECLFRLETEAKARGHVIRTRDRNWLTIVRPYVLEMGKLQKNFDLVNANVDTESQGLKSCILVWINKIQVALEEYMISLFVEAPDKKRMSDLLFAAGVPFSVYKRFREPANLESSSSLVKLLFPANPFGGLRMSLREILDDTMWDRLPPVLKATNIALRRILDDEDVLGLLLGVPANVVRSDNPALESAFAVEFPLCPSDPSVIWDYGKKGKLNFPSLALGSTPKDAMVNLAIGFARTFTTSFTTDSPAEKAFGLIHPGLRLGDLTVTNNLFVQLSDAGVGKWPSLMMARAAASSYFLGLTLLSEARITSDTKREAILTVLGVPSPFTKATAIAAYNTLATTNVVDPFLLPGVAQTQVESLKERFFFEKIESESDAKRGFLQVFSNEEKKKANKMMAKTLLAKRSKELVRPLIKSHGALKEPVRNWLQSFGVEELQIAGAELLVAAFGQLEANCFGQESTGNLSEDENDLC